MRQSQALQHLLDSGIVWRGQEVTPPQAPQSKKLFGELCQTYLLPKYVHEWSLELPPALRSLSYAPHHVLWATLAQLFSAPREPNSAPRHIAWIGRELWPFPHFLFHPPQADETTPPEALSDKLPSLFLAPRDKRERIWTVAQVLSSPAFAAVLIDGRGLSFPATRKLQLLARQSNAVTFLIRPPEELSRPSAARTRWRVRTHAADAFCWDLELLRAPGLVEPQEWTIQFTHPAQLQFSSANSSEEEESTSLRHSA